MGENNQKELARLRAFHDYFASMYGQGLKIVGWHLNGNLESFDNFFDTAEEQMDEVKVDE